MAVLINGDGYSPVTAQQDADFYAGIFGQRLRVLDIGRKMAASIISPTCVRVADGEAIVQGRRIHNNVGTYDDFEIPVGEQGITKYYIIGYRLFRDTDTKEKAETFVREVASSTATITEDVLRNGATETYISFYRVTKIGFVIDSVTPMYISSQALVNNYPIGSIYMSTSPTNPSELFGGTWQEIQGKFLLGRSSGHAAGTTGGAESVKIAVNQLPAHTHTGPSHTHSMPSHTHTGTTAKSGNHRHAIKRYQTAAIGGNRFCIQGSDDNVTFNSNYAGEHTHTFTTNAGGSGNTGASGTGATGSTGGNQALSIMPPFLAVYMWTRIS